VDDFQDLLAANATYAETFADGGFDGIAKAGVGIVTCMDSRIEPLAMLGLDLGDAKILRTPGGRVDHTTLEALVIAVHLLGVERVLVVAHTRCAMASSTTQELRDRIEASAGQDASWLTIGAIPDQIESLADDVQKLRTHPLVPESVSVGGFIYDVDTGALSHKF
jgi:carbonic anhydrase